MRMILVQASCHPEQKTGVCCSRWTLMNMRGCAGATTACSIIGLSRPLLRPAVLTQPGLCYNPSSNVFLEVVEAQFRKEDRREIHTYARYTCDYTTGIERV